MGDKNKTSLMMELNDRLETIVEYLMPVRTALVFVSSMFTVVFSMLLAFYLRHDFSFYTPEAEYLPHILLLAIIVKLGIFLIFRLYEGMWKYVSIIDLMKILAANIAASAILMLLVYLARARFFPGFSLPVIVIDFLICFLIMSGKRVIVRIVRESAAKASGIQALRTIIVGTSENVNSLIHAFSASPSRRKIIGALCEGIKTGRTIRGVPVLGIPSSAAKCAKKHRASEILLLPPYSSPKNLRDIMDELEERNAKCGLRMVPVYTDVAEGNISVSHIKEVEIEDLLGRKPVKLDRTEVENLVKGRNIIVTGAGGSIGSELCRQIASYGPGRLVLFELSEYNLYEINRKLIKQFPKIMIVNVIGDVRSKNDLERVFTENNVDIVYHAAAYKHVPLMEENPTMAFKTNLLGTACLAECCEKYNVRRMVMISSDKAVNPTSVMGATKRLAEKVVLERPKDKTEFVVVRFGNVLGSSGSVIPLFKQQIKEGGPVTVTSENMVRYFMSIPEAVDLVLEAGSIGKDRDIMVLEMGEQVRIYDMARKLIELSGFVPGEDIEIKVTGIRPGEKEYEELLTEKETVDSTPYDRIFVFRKSEETSPSVDIEKIRRLVDSSDIPALKQTLAEYIPENKFSEGL